MFVFYDTETTGLDKDFSQILQIALVFTDDNLNILSTKKVECRCSPWVIPSPGALLTTGFVPDDLKNNKLSHYEMMREVDSWLRGQHWPVTFVGYNSIAYDEPVLAQNFYQNLLDKNLTTGGDGPQSNGRGDVMLLVRAAAVYMPDALTLKALNAYGTTSMTLKDVSQQNGVHLSDEDAHDAMNDIKATIGVAKVLQKAAPQIWNQLMKLTTRAGVDDFLSTHKTFTYLNMAYGAKARPVVMTSVVPEEGTAGQVLFDLSIDPTPYLSMTAEQLKDVLMDRRGPFSTIRKDAQPVLMPVDAAPDVLPTSYNEKLAATRVRQIQSNADFLKNLSAATALARTAQAKPPAHPSQPESSIWEGVSDALKPRLEAWFNDFHKAGDWKAATAVLKDFYARFKDDVAADQTLTRFAKFAGRIIFEHAPAELTAAQQEGMKRHIAGRVLTPNLNVPYMTVAKARKELEQIEQERAEGKKKWKDVTDSQIRALKLYYTSIEKSYEASIAPAKSPVNDNAQQNRKPPQHGNGGPKA